jgi:hypothetical protein
MKPVLESKLEYSADEPVKPLAENSWRMVYNTGASAKWRRNPHFKGLALAEAGSCNTSSPFWFHQRQGQPKRLTIQQERPVVHWPCGPITYRGALRAPSRTSASKYPWNGNGKCNFNTILTAFSFPPQPCAITDAGFFQCVSPITKFVFQHKWQGTYKATLRGVRITTVVEREISRVCVCVCSCVHE